MHRRIVLKLRSGTVYLGTWNRTEVAIKVLQNVAGIRPSLMVNMLPPELLPMLIKPYTVAAE